jgi:hypothetical protein
MKKVPNVGVDTVYNVNLERLLTDIPEMVKLWLEHQPREDIYHMHVRLGREQRIVSATEYLRMDNA